MSEYDAWREKTFGTPYMVWHDGIDPNRFPSLSQEERAEAIAVIPAGLRAGDWLAAVGARVLEMTGALPILEERLKGARGRFAVEAARAVIALGGDPAEAVAVPLRALRDPSWSGRVDVAVGLRHFGGEAVVAALLERVAEDPDYLVRYHAAESLLRLGKVHPAAISEHPEVFADLVAGSDTSLADEDRERHRAAAGRLREMLGG